MSSTNKKYWLSFGEQTESPISEQQAHDEFAQKLPKEHAKSVTAPSRRDFLKLMGFSTTAAVLASCDKPLRNAVSYLNRPNQEVAGEADFFATTYRQNAEIIPIVAKVREGRPIKLEGNKLSSLTNGATSARLQASVLDLYNTARLKFPTKGQQELTLESADAEIGAALTGLQGSQITLVTSSVSSPSTKRVIELFQSRYKGSRHIQTDAISYAALLLANEQCYGRKEIPFYQFNKADVIVSFGADFLGTWLLPTVFANQYAQYRKLAKAEDKMNHHIHFESVMTITGSNADLRYTHSPRFSSSLLYDLFSLLKGESSLLTNDDKLAEALRKAAIKLLSNKGKSLVVSGSNQVRDQWVVNQINTLLESNGNTINWATPINSVNAIDTDVLALVDDIEKGVTKAVIFAECNPVQFHHAGGRLKNAISKLQTSISLSTFADETAELCQFVVPSHHYLESWNDEQVVKGYLSFTQPTIVNLFKTRQWQESLLKWSGNDTSYADFIESFWIAKLGSRNTWKAVQRDGILDLNVTSPSFVSLRPVTFSGDQFVPKSNVEGLDLVLYQKIGIGEGSQAGNPWLQELPDPVTKATWGNYVLLSYKKAKALLGIDLTSSRDADAYEVNVNKPVVKVSSGNLSVELPVVVLPGIDENTIAIALGYGRKTNLGVAAKNLGEDVYPFLQAKDGITQYIVGGVLIEKTDKTAPVAVTQSHHSYEGRTEVIKETTLAAYALDKDFFSRDKTKLVEDYAKKTGDYANEATLYDVHRKNGIHWGMSVDLNSCIGCGACVIACNAENNVAVVGKDEVLRGHEMHWMRIDRYFSGSPENPEVIHQPMMCQHCDNAPCENVCPVSATNHSSEGLNQMSYNRCVGTRYCANNCPFKVRRFNWADYLGADAVENNQKEAITAVALDMNDELTRMVLNPDVTVRSRGVMEKCSFCAQRLQAAKLNAKKNGVALPDTVETACVQACPTHAIVFGNVLNEQSKIASERLNKRSYNVLEQIHVLPNVGYLGKVRNV